MPDFSKILDETFVAAVEHHARIGSTNDRAIACAPSPDGKLPVLIVADEQTAGRGRGGNRWWTGAGSLAFSLLLASAGPKGASRRSMLASLAAGISVAEAVAPRATGHAVRIHWPNDVMLDGRKLAGILIEVLPDGKQVVGIGVNVNNTAADAPDDVRHRVATLRDATGRLHDRFDLLRDILRGLEARLAESAAAPDRIVARTNELCAQCGEDLRVVQGDTVTEGRCLGVASDGALLLEVAGRTRSVHSGVVLPAQRSV